MLNVDHHFDEVLIGLPGGADCLDRQRFIERFHAKADHALSLQCEGFPISKIARRLGHSPDYTLRLLRFGSRRLARAIRNVSFHFMDEHTAIPQAPRDAGA